MSQQKRLLITARSFRKVEGPHLDILRDSGYELRESPEDRPLKEDELIELIEDVDGGIFGVDEITSEVIRVGKRLRVISRYGVGVDKVDLAACTRAGVVVTNTPGANSISAAELTIGLLLSLARSIPQHDVSVREGIWKRIQGYELFGKTLGIVGLGWVSREVVKRASCFSMEIVIHTRYPDEELAASYKVSYVSLEQLLKESDFVSLHCTVTPDRVNLIDEFALRTMKPTAWLINTARGLLVDEDALYRALREGWIRGAAVDAFRQEPTTDSPLLELDNVIATPHIGAATYEATLRAGLMASQNALRVLRGERPEHVINPEVYKTL